jgi:DNA processing protein
VNQKDLKIINAINTLATAKIDALKTIEGFFNGDWEKAWDSNLKQFLPSDLDYINARKRIDPEKEWLKLKTNGIELITIHDPAYPPLLKHIAHPPFLLYIRGSKELLKSLCFGVVGTRALTDYGKRVTPQITQSIVAGGFTIASGLAMGIDTLAHKTAIDAGGKTIAVLGSGIDDAILFPPQNLELAKKILKTGGSIISEYAPGTHGSPFTFPQRNRIVSGLSKGVLVVEADVKSGALITAKCAVEQNRDLFCIPGNIYNRTSQGTNFMIQKGAKLVLTGNDILEEYNIEPSKVKREIRADNEVEAKILALLTGDSLSSDDIIRKTGEETSKIVTALVMMELNRKIKAIGNKFVLNS